MSRITPFDAKTQIDRLIAAGFNLPPKSTVPQLAQAWAEAMNDIDELDLVAAVDDYRRTGHYWPKPADLRVRAVEARKARPRADGQVQPLAEEYWAWENHQHDEQGKLLGGFTNGKPDRGCSRCEAGCPVCGARYQWQPRLVIVHDARQHEQADIGWAGYSRADVEFYQQADESKRRVEEAKFEQQREREQAAARAQLEREQVARKMGTALLAATAAAELEPAGV